MLKNRYLNVGVRVGVLFLVFGAKDCVKGYVILAFLFVFNKLILYLLCITEGSTPFFFSLLFNHVIEWTDIIKLRKGSYRW